MKPRLCQVRIRHVRAEPVHHEVDTASYAWFVDVDELPHVPGLVTFSSREVLGDPTRSIRENVVDYLTENGIDIGTGRITMLANPRSLGYAFNPLTVFWCHDDSGALVCAIAEVHNTYGGGHRYLLQTDDAGRAETEKKLYVSPFYPVDGYYRISVPEPTDRRVDITVTLHRPGGKPFVATMRGDCRPATPARIARTLARRPVETWRTRAAITAHGIRLWRAGLPVQPRPEQEQPMPKRTAATRIVELIRASTGLELPVRIRAWDGSEAGPVDAPLAIIRSRRALRRLLWAPGELGLARAYVTGDLDVEGDLADGLRRAWRMYAQGARRPDLGLSAKLRAAAGAARLGAFGLPPKAPASEAVLSGTRHTRARDRDAIAHHYDLSNDFYALLMDESMAYSSAYFTHEGQSLADAQRAKLDLICRKLDLKPGMHLLDVGCGWGSLVVHAAQHYGVRVTGITLSAQQRDHIVKRLHDAGLQDQVEVRLQDYRVLAETGETFDAVSSIEMGEHVGQENYGVYASTLFGALKPRGRLLLQQMSRKAGAAPGGGAFIEAYIAPDMHMRPLPETMGFLEDAGFELRDVEAMREHYVTTVAHWLDTFEANYDEFVALVGEEMARVWRLYLVGGALSFEQGRMGVDQILAVRADDSAVSGMPATRPWAV